MASLIYLDTHAVAWLFLGRLDGFPEAAQDAINEAPLVTKDRGIHANYPHAVWTASLPAEGS